MQLGNDRPEPEPEPVKTWPWWQHLEQKVAQTLGISSCLITIFPAAVLTILVTMSCSQAAVIRMGVGFLYPAYKSLHAIMSDDREAGLAWMRYWVVLAVFSLLETLLDPLLDFLPGYLLSKCIFLVWCMAPSSKSGSNLVFTQVCTGCPVTSL